MSRGRHSTTRAGRRLPWLGSVVDIVPAMASFVSHPRALAFLALLPLAAPAAHAASVFTSRPDDPAAVTLQAPDFAVRADGTPTTAPRSRRRSTRPPRSRAAASLFVPSGRYRLTRTLYVWRGVRVIGYGATRPVLRARRQHARLPEGHRADGDVHAREPRPAPPPPRAARVPFPPPGSVPPSDDIPDAGPEHVLPGDEQRRLRDRRRATRPRSRSASTSRSTAYLSHMDFHVGSGLAALTEIGNEAEDLHFYGGRYGILTDNTSPFWQFTLIDSTFEGQRDAAIREHMARPDARPRHVPQRAGRHRHRPALLRSALGEGQPVRARLEAPPSSSATRATPPRRSASRTRSARTCRSSRGFARAARTRAGAGPIYRVSAFNHGLFVPGLGAMGHIDTLYRRGAARRAARRRCRPRSARCRRWSSGSTCATLGVKGDGQTDDTAALQAAVDAHPRALLPQRLLHRPRHDRAEAGDGAHRAAPGHDAARPAGCDARRSRASARRSRCCEAPQGGTNIVSGLGLYTGGINPRATEPAVDGGRAVARERRADPWAAAAPTCRRTCAPRYYRDQPRRRPRTASDRWGAQYPSIWVTRGGGGTFTNIWSPDTYAQGGFYVSDTTTPGHVYELSDEHHLFNEIKLDRVENWEFLAPQTEEEAPTSPEAVSLEIAWSKQHHHRQLPRLPRDAQPRAVPRRGPPLQLVGHPLPQRARQRRERLRHLRRRTAAARSCASSKFPYENAIQDVTHRLEVREREFAVLDVPAPAPQPAHRRQCRPCSRPARRLRKLESAASTRSPVRRVGRAGHALLRRSPPAPHLLVVAGARARRRPARRRSTR